MLVSEPEVEAKGGRRSRYRLPGKASNYRVKIGAGRAVKAHLVDCERAASTYSYQNEKQQAPQQKRSEPLSEI
ncbi:hypothetical protein V2J09_008999 [Rumex salicifolius]